MCPFFRAAPGEERSPRAKANAVRQLSIGHIPWHELASPEFKKLADLCFNCKQCQWECPASIDVPHLMIEAKAHHVQAQGVSRAEWVLTRFPGWANWLARWSPVMNGLLNTHGVRWLLERLLGIARQRKLPPLAKQPFLKAGPARWFDPARLNDNGKPVIYFVDHVANAHDPQIAWAFGRILEHHGIPLYVPPHQGPAGMAAFSCGDLDAARAYAERNIHLLAEFAREGCPIVCTEPSAAVCLKYDYPLLLEHPDAELVAAHVTEAGAFLRGLHAAGRLKTDFEPVKARTLYHTPCHVKTLSRESPLAEICGWIPGLEVHRIEAGCSGMAGIYGLQRRNFEQSMEIGSGLVAAVREQTWDFGLTECSSCKWQMEQTVDTPTLHPLLLLGLAYGILPEARERMRPNPRRLLTS
jgi:Fe-S oxidoreductase